jgi:putative transposase
MDESEIKKQAISRYEDGESPKQIYQSLGKSKRWFFKWLKRYKEGNDNWWEELSRKPHSTKQKIDKDMEQAIIDTREKLERTLYAQIGVLLFCQRY